MILQIKNLASLTILAITFLMVGCSTVKIPQATGGSRSDAVVNMSYEYSWLEKPVIDWEKARMEAQNRCRVWGFVDAVPFGGSTTECISRNDYGACVRQIVTNAYQCTE